MGTHVIRMPDIGEGIAEVEIVQWRGQPGPQGGGGPNFVDVMTDKAPVEIPSPVHGMVFALGGALGQTLPVGAELIRLEVEGAGNGAQTRPARAIPAAATTPAASAAPPVPERFVPHPASAPPAPPA